MNKFKAEQKVKVEKLCKTNCGHPNPKLCFNVCEKCNNGAVEMAWDALMKDRKKWEFSESKSCPVKYEDCIADKNKTKVYFEKA